MECGGTYKYTCNYFLKKVISILFSFIMTVMSKKSSFVTSSLNVHSNPWNLLILTLELFHMVVSSSEVLVRVHIPTSAFDVSSNSRREFW